jgi:Skp family chaperone for outer membrane proteins
VKRKIVLLAILAVFGAATYFGKRVDAQQPGVPGVPGVAAQQPTRIGLVNMVAVLKSYRKFTTVETELKRLQSAWEEKLKPMQAKLVNMQNDLRNPNTPAAQREQIERDGKKMALEFQSLEEDAKKDLAKHTGDAYVQIYREVEDAVKRFAASNGYALVLFYNDAITPEDQYHPANIQRKLLQPAAIMPMVVSPGMDITTSIAAQLNAMYPGAPAPGAPGAGGAPAPGH